MEEGRLTDSFGRHIDFRNTVLIMTSNIGADKITHQTTFGFERRDENVSYEKMRNMLKTELDNYFRPEFLNRVDEIVVFRKLGHEQLVSIVELELTKVRKRLIDHALELEVTQEAKEFLLARGTDEKFGARPLRRAIEQQVEDPLSEAILRGEFRGKDRVLVKVREEGGEKKLVFEGVESTPPPAEPALAASGAETT
jgi:ATP-dependent Clp protease ATP-binding subunit ClpC